MTTLLKSRKALPSGFSGRGLTTTHVGDLKSDIHHGSDGALFLFDGTVYLSDQLRDALMDLKGLNISPTYRHTLYGLPAVPPIRIPFQSIVLSPKMSCRLYVVAALYGPYRSWEQERVMHTLGEYWQSWQERTGLEYGSTPTMPDNELRLSLYTRLAWQAYKQK